MLLEIIVFILVKKVVDDKNLSVKVKEFVGWIDKIRLMGLFMDGGVVLVGILIIGGI